MVLELEDLSLLVQVYLLPICAVLWSQPSKVCSAVLSKMLD